jgi:spore maturation protein CgeB
MFIGGLNIPDYIFESLYHVKSIVVSTEDPHSSLPMLNRINLINYYFSNERSIGNSKKYPNVYYCPTAADADECGRLPTESIEPKYHSDILFLGAMYPNRKRLLEAIIPFVKRNKLNFKVCGHVQYLPKKSPLWEYVFDSRTIPHSETVKYYNGAKVVLNILRDINWNPRTRTKNNPYKGKYPAESLNPRAYEVPMCQAFMLLEDTRAEAREIFTEGEVGFFSNEKSLIDRLRYFLIGKGDALRGEMAFEAYKKVASNHTYTHRLQYIKAILDK